MTDESRDPWLLTPGPLTTSRSVKEAMLHDWGSRDKNFIAINRRVRERLVSLAGAEGSHVCVPLQGSGTFVVEATVGTLVPRDAKALILVNGAYGKRIAKICDYYRRRYVILETAENVPCNAADVDGLLADDAALSHVFVIHCETTSGILNPVADVAQATARHGRKLIIDAMSAFGAVPLDAREVPFDALVASSNKCIEGVPGVGFAIIRESSLKNCKGNAPSLTLDLYDQWQAMEKNAQWRFTPPTHVIVAFDQALREHEEEGGGMRELGFETLLPDELQAPIIVTFHMPADPSFVFQTFYDYLGERGFVIYPGKLTVADSFRIGCIGRLGEEEMRGALVAVGESLAQMGVTQCGPKQSSSAVA